MSCTTSAGDAGQWLPDMRMHRVHEKLQYMVDGLAQQAAQAPKHPIPAPPRTPPAFMKMENGRLRKKLLDAKEQVETMERTMVQFVKAKETVKVREAWLSKYGLVGRFFAYDTAIFNKMFAAWARHVICMKKSRMAREQAAQSVEYAAVQFDLGLLAKCMGVWSTSPIVTSNRKRVVRTLGDWFQRGKGGALEQQAALYFALWTPQGRLRYLQRLVDESDQRTAKLQEQWILRWEAVMQRFGSTVMAQLRKMIGKDQATCTKLAIQSWTDAVQQAKLERKARLEAEEAERLAQKRRIIAAERIFGKTTRTLFSTCMRGWLQEVEDTKVAKAKLNEAIDSAMARMFGSQMAVLSEVIGAWAASVMEDRIARARADMEAGRRLVAEAKARAMKMFGKKGKPPEELLVPCMTCWVEMVEDQHRRRLGKESAMAMVLRGIRRKGSVLQSISIGFWAMIAGCEKARSKDRALWESAARERFLGLAHGTIMRLHKRLAVTHIFEAWVLRSSL